MPNILEQAKKVHFIGIGGIGISAIARMFMLEGKSVTGSDGSNTDIVQALVKAGAKIEIGQKAENVPYDADLVIYTIAITEENPELREVRKRNIKAITYPQALHEISKNKFTIAVSGTHGKTTTTAMIAKVMIDAGLDPTVIVGSLIKKDKDSGFATNFIAGKSKYLVVEACEYRRSFLNIEPSILAITNIDNDHLDYYKDVADIQSAFREMALKLGKDGYLVTDLNNKTVIPAIKDLSCQKVDYIENLDKNMKLLIPGEHNKKDAAVAISVAKILGLDLEKAKKSLETFAGTWRRFEYKGKSSAGALIYDDYGHHPTEVKATLAGARELYPDKKIIVVFQPHLFSRTKLLLNDFATAFSGADEIILAPIFPAREVFDPTISSEILAGEIRKNQRPTPAPSQGRGSEGPSLGGGFRRGSQSAHAFPDFDSIINYLKSSLKAGDVLITMGAGEQYKVGESLL